MLLLLVLLLIAATDVVAATDLAVEAIAIISCLYSRNDELQVRILCR